MKRIETGEMKNSETIHDYFSIIFVLQANVGKWLQRTVHGIRINDGVASSFRTHKCLASTQTLIDAYHDYAVIMHFAYLHQFNPKRIC